MRTPAAGCFGSAWRRAPWGPGWLGLALAGGMLVRNVLAAAPEAPTGTRLIDSYSQMGIDQPQPRFGWLVNDADRGEKQTAYQLIVATNLGDIDTDQGTLWDSGKVNSSNQYGISYGGPMLAKTTHYWWKVRTWDKDGQPSPWSGAADFVTGFFQPGDWAPGAQWIGSPSASDPSNNPCCLFRTTFVVSKPVQEAYLFICGLGQFVASLNGARIGDHEIDPAWTDYLHSLNYVTFDLASQLQPGTNALGFALGPGWFSYGSPTTTGTYFYGTMRAIAQLHLVYADGSAADIVTGPGWKTAASPFTYAEVFGLENYDARLEQPGWDTTAFDDSTWTNAIPAAAPSGRLESQRCPPVVTQKVYPAVSISNPTANVYVFDLGQNINGQHEITVHGPAGATVEIVPGEWLDGNGRVMLIKNYTHSLYTLKGSASNEVWRLTFSTVGFRYIEVRNATRNLQQTNLPYIQDVKGYATYTAAPEVGSFTASDARYNQIHALALQTLQNNLVSIHTDCPTWEKLGWQEVVADTFPSSMYYHDLETLLAKIAKDTREGQLNRSLGYVPNIVPNWFLPVTGEGGDYDNSPSWGTSAFQAPWMVYWIYGDTQALADSYSTMKTYLAYLKSREVAGVVNYGLGDYLAPAGPQVPNVEGAAYVFDTRIMRDTASALGKAADASYYSNEFARVQAAYNSTYFDTTNQWYFPVTQGNNAIPLAYGIVPAGRERAVASALIRDLAQPQETTAYSGYYGSVLPGHLTVGDVGCTYLWRALGNYAQADLVQNAILQPTPPSYLAMVNAGQTTLTENWNSLASRSFDHDMYAGIFEWLYRSLGGISAARPGYEEIQLKPDFPSGLSSVSCSYQCVRGTIGSSWYLTNQDVVWDIRVPPNATARVYVPLQTASLWITESGTNIWQNGGAVGSVPGIAFERVEGSFPAWPAYVVWTVGSGNYEFQWPGFPPPTGLLANAGNAQVRLSWNAYLDASSYAVRRSTVSGGPYSTLLGTATATNWTDTPVGNNTNYYYVVSASTGAGASPYSFEANATPRFVLTAVGGIAQVALSWGAPPNASSYSVRRAAVSGGPYVTVASGLTSTNYTDTGLVIGTDYYYVVSAFNGANDLADSLEARATTHALLNTGFEAPVIAGYQYNPADASWTFDSAAGIAANASGFTINNPAAPEGVQVAFLQGTGAIWQDVNGLAGGIAYTVTFSAAQRNYPQAGQTFALTLDGTNLASFSPPQSAVTYTDYVASFTTTPGTHRLAFVGTNLKGGDNTILIDNVRLAATAPAAPTGLVGQATNGQAILHWSAVAGATAYNLKRSLTNGGTYAVVAGGLTATNWTDGNLVNGTRYYYVVSALNAGAESTNSSEISVTPRAWLYAVNSGGGAAGVFAADENYAGGFVNASTAAVDTSAVTNPAPQGVYQTERAGNFTYTFTNLSSAAQCLVRLHFAELFYTGAGQRLFNVSINGALVLTNFDIWSAAGGRNKALVREFLAPPGTGGALAIEFTSVVDSPKSSGIEMLLAAPAPPAARNLSVLFQGTEVHLSIASAAGWRYQLQYRDSLATGAWLNLGPPLDGDGGPLNFTDAPGGAVQTRFYRVLLQP